MSSIDAGRVPTGGMARRADTPALKARTRTLVMTNADNKPDVIKPDEKRKPETFIPITGFALIDRLTRPDAWPPGQAREARRFFRYLSYWRRQQYNAHMLSLEQDYEPFSPDSDLLVTRSYSTEERLRMQKRCVQGIERLLKQANFVRIDPETISFILSHESHYGLDLNVDLDAFEELLIFYRGASSRREQRRMVHKFMRKQEFDVPIFRRLFVLFKLKPEAQRIKEMISREGLSGKDAEKHVKRMRALLPPAVRDDNIYMKLFKNIPRGDVEMIFPNTQVKFRLLDKIKLGVTGGAGLGFGVFSAAGKLALAATNPVAAAGAVAGLGGIAFRQAVKFMNQRQRYMVVMAQNLYFHAMADNRGVMVKLADRASDEDVKEEILLYTVLAKEPVNRRDLHLVDKAIERYLLEAFDSHVDFDLHDALDRLIADGLVVEDADGHLRTLAPADAANHIDRLWDGFLDDLPDPTEGEGVELESNGRVVTNAA